MCIGVHIPLSQICCTVLIYLSIQKLLISSIQERLERLVPAHQKYLKLKEKTEKELKRYRMCVGGGEGEG